MPELMRMNRRCQTAFFNDFIQNVADPGRRQLIAVMIYENKVMFQGFLWNVNSFDQEGVQLGKTIAKSVLSGKMEGALKAYAELLIK